MPKFPAQTTKPLLMVTLSPGLKRGLKRASASLGCSMGELVRVSLYEYLTRLSVLSEEAKRKQPPDLKGEEAQTQADERGGQGDLRGAG